jgi:hypothetical protein
MSMKSRQRDTPIIYSCVFSCHEQMQQRFSKYERTTHQICIMKNVHAINLNDDIIVYWMHDNNMLEIKLESYTTCPDIEKLRKSFIPIDKYAPLKCPTHTQLYFLESHLYFCQKSMQYQQNYKKNRWQSILI